MKTVSVMEMNKYIYVYIFFKYRNVQQMFITLVSICMLIDFQMVNFLFLEFCYGEIITSLRIGNLVSNNGFPNQDFGQKVTTLDLSFFICEGSVWDENLYYSFQFQIHMTLVHKKYSA